jgi:integrase
MAADDLSSELHALFEKWIASGPGRGRGNSHALGNESAEVYRDMWNTFVAYCLPVGVDAGSRSIRLNPLESLTAADLESFLSLTGPAANVHGRVRGDALALRYAWRMLHLIDRVLSFRLVRTKAAGTTAAAALLQEAPYRFANAASQDPEVDILTDGEVRRLMAFLTAELPEERSIRGQWKLLRDRALVGLMLGAGLAPGDVQSLLLDGVTIDDGPVAGIPWRLTVTADALSPEHQTPVAGWAGELLGRWLTERTRSGLPGPFVFPSTMSGKGLSRPSVHLIAVGVFEEAGVTKGAPFRLRHTFAVRQLTKGHTEDEVGAWLGIVESRPMQRYRKFVVKAPDLA